MGRGLLLGFPSGGAGFTKDSVSGLLRWWKADALSYVEGNSVSQWDDSSGNAGHAIQATGTKQPTYRAAPTGFNGKPGVEFDGGDGLVTSGNVSLGPFTVFAVWRASGTPGFIYEHSVNSGTNNGHFLYATIGTTVNVKRAGGVQEKNLTNNWGVDGAVRVTAQVFDGVNISGCKLYINGADQSLTTVTNTGTDTNSASAVFSIGARNAASIFLTGVIAEILVYNSALGSGDRGVVFTYLGSKYGITVS